MEILLVSIFCRRPFDEFFGARSLSGLYRGLLASILPVGDFLPIFSLWRTYRTVFFCLLMIISLKKTFGGVFPMMEFSTGIYFMGGPLTAFVLSKIFWRFVCIHERPTYSILPVEHLSKSSLHREVFDDLFPAQDHSKVFSL